METGDAAIILLTEMLKGIKEDVKGVREELSSDRQNASASRQRVYEKLEEVQETQADHGSRLVNVEQSIESEKPTWQEYRETKQRVAGAGLLGRTLWRFGRWLIVGAFMLAGWAYSARDQIAAVWHRLWP